MSVNSSAINKLTSVDDLDKLVSDKKPLVVIGGCNECPKCKNVTLPKCTGVATGSRCMECGAVCDATGKFEMYQN